MTLIALECSKKKKDPNHLPSVLSWTPLTLPPLSVPLLHGNTQQHLWGGRSHAQTHTVEKCSTTKG